MSYARGASAADMEAEARVRPASFDPTAIAGIGDNQPPELTPFELVKEQIEDLFGEATHWADGEPIASQEMHDAIEKLYDGLHECGKRADALRVEEKKPLDDKITAIQAAYNPLIQPKKGKVDLGKSELGKLLAAWRAKVVADKAALAAKIAADAAEAQRIAAEAIRASSGNLAQRVEAEEQLANATSLTKAAKRADKAATTGTGLRTVWLTEVDDENKALDWAFERSPGEFRALATRLAEEAVRGGARAIAGFRIWDEQRATV